MYKKIKIYLLPRTFFDFWYYIDYVNLYVEYVKIK